MDLSIIIINWNSKALLRDCLKSIYGGTHGLLFEAIVVDNASFDGCEAMLAREFPEVVFFQSNRNLGFSRGNNLGFERSRGRNLLFLNPDTVVAPGAIATMMAVLEEASDAGVVGCKLLNGDGTIQTSCIQRWPSPLSQALDVDFLRRWFPAWKMWGTEALIVDPAGPLSAEVISGACLMISRAVFVQCGRFSIEYFMYAEDADLCYRVNQLPRNNYYVASATVTHFGGASSAAEGSRFSTLMMRRSLLRFMEIHGGNAYGLAYRAAMFGASVARISVVLVALVATLGQVRRHALLVILRKWWDVLRWAIGLEPDKERHALMQARAGGEV